MADLPFHATAFLLLFARVGAVVMLLPAFSDDGMPGQIRLMLAIGMTLGLYGLLDCKVAAASADEAGLAATVIAEMLVGIAMGMIVRILFNTAAMAGGLISVQVGLSSTLIADASMGGQVPLLAKFITVAATVSCMALGVHHLWIGMIVHSYDLFPVGHLPPGGDFAQLAIQATTRATGLALGMAAPLIAYGILFNVALGISARVAPTIQIFFIAQPLNILLGLTLLAGTLGVALTGFSQAMAAFMRTGWAF
ncbi:flagellar biosynthetic protein FliR [Sphingomonas sp. PR090111-T3T-6A]|uniref:flagellar biosynthetic protein FliR n=1 Tax=Sphingomonas sp. PR090111-T3T-6A TaxID=685778 RepID=UPI0003726593|nr:flagellar biosynthetic protein FliR [Sphingomonas sp. PR090111-T3T-6A]